MPRQNIKSVILEVLFISNYSFLCFVMGLIYSKFTNIFIQVVKKYVQKHLFSSQFNFRKNTKTDQRFFNDRTPVMHKFYERVSLPI